MLAGHSDHSSLVGSTYPLQQRRREVSANHSTRSSSVGFTYDLQQRRDVSRPLSTPQLQRLSTL